MEKLRVLLVDEQPERVGALTHPGREVIGPHRTSDEGGCRYCRMTWPCCCPSPKRSIVPVPTQLSVGVFAVESLFGLAGLPASPSRHVMGTAVAGLCLAAANLHP